MRPLPNNIKAILWMVAMTSMDAALLSTVHFLTLKAQFQGPVLAFNAYFTGMVVCLLLLLRKENRAMVKTTQHRLYLLRAVLEVTGTMLVFTALSRLALSEAKAVGYLTPVLAMAGAAFVLKEHLRYYRVVAVAMGFIGMLLITRPDVGDLDALGVLMVIGSTLCYATCSLIIKTLGKKDSPQTIVFYMFLFTAPLSFLFAFPEMNITEAVAFAPQLALVGLAGYAIQYAVTKAFSLAPLNVVIPYSFISLVLVSISGYVVFAEIPRPSTFIGAGVILGGVCYAAWREAKRSGLIKEE